MNTDRNRKIKNMCISAIFIALAYAATAAFHIKVVFLTFDFKDAIMLIGAMICGPIYAVLMPVITALIEFFTFSETGVYGLVMNILSSCAFALPACLVYNFKRTLKSAIFGITTAVFTMTAVMMIANLIITPYYYKMDVAGVAAMIPTLLLPFNLTKSLLNAGMVMLLYKPVTRALRKARLMSVSDKKDGDRHTTKKSSIIMVISSLVLVGVSLAVFFVILGGKVTFGV